MSNTNHDKIGIKNIMKQVHGSLVVDVALHQRFSRRVDATLLQGLPSIFLKNISHVLGQDLSQLHSPLIITVQLPDKPFHRCPVLVYCQKLSAFIRIQLP